MKEWIKFAYTCPTVRSGVLSKMIHQGVQGNSIHLLSPIWLEDKTDVDLVLMWLDGIEWFWHLLPKTRMLVEVRTEEWSGPLLSIVLSEILGNLESSCHSRRCGTDDGTRFSSMADSRAGEGD